MKSGPPPFPPLPDEGWVSCMVRSVVCLPKKCLMLREQKVELNRTGLVFILLHACFFVVVFFFLSVSHSTPAVPWTDSRKRKKESKNKGHVEKTSHKFTGPKKHRHNFSFNACLMRRNVIQTTTATDAAVAAAAATVPSQKKKKDIEAVVVVDLSEAKNVWSFPRHWCLATATTTTLFRNGDLPEDGRPRRGVGAVDEEGWVSAEG